MSKTIFSCISDCEIEIIHERTLDVLEKLGIKIPHHEALLKLKKAKAIVDESTGLVKFPRGLVAGLLGQIPKYARMTGINGKVLDVGGENRYCGSLVIDPFIIDYEKGPRRPVLEDVRKHTIIGESLDEIAFLARMQYPVLDVEGPDSYLKTKEVFLSHTSKNTCTLPTSVEDLQEWMEVFEVIADAAGLDVMTEPLTCMVMAVTSPMQIHELNVEIIKAATTRNYPVIPTVCPMAGTTAPYSLAGGALVANVECLSACLLTQIYKPGHPVLYKASPSVTNMKSGHDLYSGVEATLFNMIAGRMSAFYNIPFSGGAGVTLSSRPDVQNGVESGLFSLASATLPQNNHIYGMGTCYNANAMSAEQIIMHCGLMDMAEYVSRGVDFGNLENEMTSIANVGPGGNFLTDAFTIERLHDNEFFNSPYFDLSGGYDENASGMLERAHQKAEDLVRNYKCAVDGKVVAAIKKFFEGKYTNKNIAKM